MNRRLFLAGVAAMATSRSFAQPAPWPTKPIRFIVPYSAGGPTDVAARILGEALSQRLAQHVVIENVTGAGTTVGTARAAGSKDGHTFLTATVAHAVNAVLYANLTFDPVRDFRGVALIGKVPQIVLVRKEFAGTSLADLIAAARAKPGGLTYGSAGIGSAQHLAAELLASLAKINIVHVPYRGSGPAVTALMGGHVQAVWADYPTVVSQLKSGTLRALVTTSPKRLAVLPGVPIMEETGITKYEAEIFYGLVAPAKTPPQAIKSLSEMLLAAMNTPEMKAKFDQQGLFPDGTCGAKFGTFLQNITADYEKITTAAGIKPN